MISEPRRALSPRSLGQLLRVPPEILRHVDIGRMNLLCSTDLPGVRPVDVPGTLRVLDDLSQQIARTTAAHWPYFEEHAEELEESEPLWRMLSLCRFLQHRWNVRYCEEERDNRSEADWKVADRHFLFGLLGPERHGTCCSIPVLLTAIGRRLGYPLKLVHSPGHVFCRWDGLDHPNPAWREQRNIEFNGNFDSHPNDHYYESPIRWNQAMFAMERRRQPWSLYLRSLTPAEELASFLVQRAQVLEENAHYKEAWNIYAAACRLSPHNDAYAYFTRECHQRHLDDVLKPWRLGIPLGIPEFYRLTELRMRGRTVSFPWEREHIVSDNRENVRTDRSASALLKRAESAVRAKLFKMRRDPITTQPLPSKTYFFPREPRENSARGD